MGASNVAPKIPIVMSMELPEFVLGAALRTVRLVNQIVRLTAKKQHIINANATPSEEG